MPLNSALMQELPIVVIEPGVKAIYCFEVELTQEDMGYDPPKSEADRLTAPHDIAVYAYTVTIKERLMLPGKNLRLFARRLVLGKGAAIDVSGAEAAISFAPGVLPQQADLNPAARSSPLIPVT